MTTRTTPPEQQPPPSPAGKLIRRLRHDGIVGTVRWAWYHVAWRYQEWRLGIRTSGDISWRELGDDPACIDYNPIDYRCFDIAMRHLGPLDGKDVFLDYGCGKGRAVVLAALYPFRKVIGVEMSPELCEVARENVARAKRKLKCQDVEVVEASAQDYVVPPDVTVVFLFNPFVGHVLKSVIERLHESFAAAPRTIRIIYMYLDGDEDLFARCSWLRQVATLSTGYWEDKHYVVYETEFDRRKPHAEKS